MPPSCGEAELDTHTQTPSADSICTHNDEKLAAQLAEQLQLRHRDEPGDSGEEAALAAGSSRQGGAATQGAAAAAPPGKDGAAASPDAAANKLGESSAAHGWDDDSDDWEPDLSSLRRADSFANSSSRGAGGSAVEDGTIDAEAAPKARGRGTSKCAAGADSDSDGSNAGSGSGRSALPAAEASHVVELYGLNRSVTTTHLESFLLDFLWQGCAANVKWVDDEHALAVFPCAAAAQALLDSGQRSYKVRPYAAASTAAQRLDSDVLLPPRAARPKTTTAVARRLISNALGNRNVRDRAAERELADLRRANKQGRQQRTAGFEAAWGGDDE